MCLLYVTRVPLHMRACSTRVWHSVEELEMKVTGDRGTEGRITYMRTKEVFVCH